MPLRFTTRLILSVVFLQALMLSVLVWNSLRLINNSHEELLNSYIKDHRAVLATTLEPGLAMQDHAMVQDALIQLQQNKSIKYIRVLDRNSNIFAEVGSGTFPDSLELKTELYTQIDNKVYTEKPIELYSQSLGRAQIIYSLEYITSLTQKTQGQSSSIAAIALTISILISVLFGVFLTKNLRKLELGVVALSNKELDYRINISSNDEFADIANAFNQLAVNTEENYSKLNDQKTSLQQEKHRMELLLNNIHAVIMEADPHNMQFKYVSQQAEALLGYKTDEWLTAGFLHEHLHPDDLTWVINTIESQSGIDGEYTIDYRLKHISGKYIWVRHIINFTINDNNQNIARGIIIDINEQKETEQRIVFLANHDSLTGLYNRRRFQEQLEQQIAYAKRFSISSALLFIDLNQFKYINDTLGHLAGDQCLISASNTLKNSLRGVDIIGRLGGDEFGVILPQINPDSARYVAENLIEALENEVQVPVAINTQISACIGIAMFPGDGSTPAELLAKADAAMYTIKRSGRGKIHLYTPEDKELGNMKAKVHWEDRIKRALRDDTFILHYQPILNIKQNRIQHHEALLRMRDDNGDLIYPGTFLETAEQFGLIRDVDKWVIRKSIQVQAESIRNGHPVSLAVNLSGRNFGDPDFMELVESTLLEFNADAGSIIFEITETAAVENIATAKTFVEDLRSLGCRIALDDFGMGYSSFHYLKNLPVDMVKIDGSFIRNLTLNNADQAIVTAIRDLTKGMGIMTVAEFVENESILKKLSEMGIDYAQGYHIATPNASFVFNFDSPAMQAKA